MNEPKQIDDGGPAFPSDNFGKPSAPGMSLRDWFAGMALQGMFSNSSMVDTFSAHVTMAQEAYNVADAMLAARKEAR